MSGDGSPRPTPAELMRDNLVLNAKQVATVLGLHYTRGKHKGDPDGVRVRELVADGRLRPVDPAQPPHRWRFSVVDVNRYIVGEHYTQPQ